ncbi:hypothetical protein B0H14DRAFT_2601190 [Mycena olivaceomarginata]|nr:hypothetical protein B0H14DRAFT_2601190 [Mycena olivaceomarginata]
MLTVPRISSALATVIIETFFYGIYLVLFLTSLYLLFTADCGPRGHWVLTIDRLFLAFVTVDNGVNPLKFYGDYSQATQIEQSTFLLVSLAIADALVVHRLWTVWSHINRYVMILPALTLMGLVASTIGVAYDFSQFKPGDSVLQLANGWIIADCASTVFGLTSAQSIVAIIVESAALSTIWALFFVIATPRGPTFVFHRRHAPIVSSANMLIYVRVGLGWAHVPTPTSSPVPIRLKAQNFSTTVAELHIRERTDGKQADLVCSLFRRTTPWRDRDETCPSTHSILQIMRPAHLKLAMERARSHIQEHPHDNNGMGRGEKGFPRKAKLDNAAGSQEAHVRFGSAQSRGPGASTSRAKHAASKVH